MPIGSAGAPTKREAKLIFKWSQTLAIDELQRRQRAVSLTFCDFLEVRCTNHVLANLHGWLEAVPS